MLSVLRFVFQPVQGASQRKEFVPRLLDPGKEFLGLGRRGSGFTPGTYFWCCTDCTQQHPRQCRCVRVQAVPNKHWLDAAWSTTLSFRGALQPCSSACPPGSSWRSLAEQHGSASSISATHGGIDPTPASLFPGGGNGTDTLPDALWSGSSKQDQRVLAMSLLGLGEPSLTSS